MGEAAESSSNTRRAARWSLHGMTALVTGGTRGIGHAVVEELAGLGAAVYTCSRKEAELAECLKKWEGLGFRVSGSVFDLSLSDQREELLRKAAKAFDGKLNILINNVGTNIRKPTVEYSGEEFSFLLSTNFESAFHMCQLAHPLLKASGMGSIIFISSVAGVVAIPSGSIYGATKGAMNQLAKNLACEWAKDNIRVNSVAPWYIKTSLVAHLMEDKEFVDRIVSRTPLGRVGEAEEVSSLGILLLHGKVRNIIVFPYLVLKLNIVRCPLLPRKLFVSADFLNKLVYLFQGLHRYIVTTEAPYILQSYFSRSHKTY